MRIEFMVMLVYPRQDYICKGPSLKAGAKEKKDTYCSLHQKRIKQATHTFNPKINSRMRTIRYVDRKIVGPTPDCLDKGIDNNGKGDRYFPSPG